MTRGDIRAAGCLLDQLTRTLWKQAMVIRYQGLGEGVGFFAILPQQDPC